MRDVFICSSYSEGFSTVATESLILGKPIITTKCSGMEELFGEYECGIIVDNNENALYDALKKVISQPFLLDKFKKEIENRKYFFNIENRIMEIEEILNE